MEITVAKYAGFCFGVERAVNTVYDIIEKNKGKKILIACHAAAIRSFWGKITKTAPEDLAKTYGFPTNASVTVVYYDGEKLIPGEYSHDDHLQDM